MLKKNRQAKLNERNKMILRAFAGICTAVLFFGLPGAFPQDALPKEPSKLISFIPFARGSGQRQVPAMAMVGNPP